MSWVLLVPYFATHPVYHLTEASTPVKTQENLTAHQVQVPR